MIAAPETSGTNLDFSSQSTLYATHGLHPFAAKCPPQVVAWALDRFTEPGDTVLDPMAGSGTTLVEACLHGRHAFGMDIDPLARLLCRVKATPLDPDLLRESASRLLVQTDAAFDLLPADPASHPYPVPTIERLDYWFCPEVVRALCLLKHHILALDEEPTIRDFFLVAFSSLILARTSVANARDVVHSRHHYMEHATPPDVRQRFRQRVRTMIRMAEAFWAGCLSWQVSGLQTRILGEDARCIPLPDDSVDLVFTSPPYCNALDYTRAHAFAIGWLQAELGVTAQEYGLLGREYIGTERAVMSWHSPDLESCNGAGKALHLTEQVAALDRKKSSALRKYFLDMHTVFSEMGRVLRPGRHLVLLVCPSHIRKVEIPTHTLFNEMAQELVLPGGRRLVPVETIERTIDDRRRLLPYMQEAFGRRMRTEYVLIYRKSG